jgi:GT2 family glycosyltransferase
MPDVRIVILNYNGEAMLPQCLPSIAEAVRHAKTPTRVTILDNLSVDQSEAYVRNNFPDVEFVKAPQNLVLCSYNAYLEKIQEPIAILLNNDIRVDKDFIDPLVRKFEEDPQTFLAAPRIHSFDGSSIEGVDSRCEIRYGMLWCSARYPGYEARAMVPARTAVSGFGAFSREKFLELGGYDLRYLPGTLEDLDLCYRAAQKGYTLYYEPRSIVFHMGQASFKKAFSDLHRETLAYRNTFLFLWKNLHGFSFWIPHLFFLPARMLWMFLKGRLGFIAGFFEAISRTFPGGHPELRRERRISRRDSSPANGGLRMTGKSDL